MRIGSDRSFSSGLTLAFSTPNTQGHEEQRPPAAAMIDAIDELIATHSAAALISNRRRKDIFEIL